MVNGVRMPRLQIGKDNFFMLNSKMIKNMSVGQEEVVLYLNRKALERDIEFAS